MKQRWAVMPPPPIQEHEAAYIEHGRMKAWIDRKICPLVLECWKRGWETGFSCENMFSEFARTAAFAQIVFLRNSDMNAFLKAIEGVVWDKCEIPAVLDETWVLWNKYTRRNGPVWATDEDNAVLFSAAGLPTVLECVRRGS